MAFSEKIPNTTRDSGGEFRQSLSRLEGQIIVLANLVNGVADAANLVASRPIEMPGAGQAGVDAPRPMLTLVRLEKDLDEQINRLRELVPILT